MDAQKLSFLTAVLGTEGAQALNKAVARYQPLESVVIPRTIMSWLSLAARTGYEGEIPGVPDTFVSFAKSENGLYAGQLSVNGATYPFEDASVLNVVAALSVALSADLSADHGVKDSDLVNLGRQVDLLAKAEFLNSFEPLQKAEPARKTVTMYHVGRDFDQFDPSFIGTGEGTRGGALNPLGPGLYGAIAEPGHEEAAKQMALRYAKYHQTPVLHTFEVDLDPAGTSFGSHNSHTRDFDTNALGAKWDSIGQKMGLRNPDVTTVVGRLGHVKANALLREHGISAKMGALDGTVHELAVFDPARLRRISKEPLAPVQKSEPAVAPPNPKRKKKAAKSFHFTKSQLEADCPDCGIPQIEGGAFTGCMCTSDMARFARLTKSDTTYTVEFGPEWGEDELSLLLFITGAANG